MSNLRFGLIILLVGIAIYQLYRRKQIRKQLAFEKAIQQKIERTSTEESQDVQAPLNTNEKIALMQQILPKDTGTATTDFEDVSISKLKSMIAYLRELQLRNSTQVLNASPEEFDSNDTLIERQTMANTISHNNGGQEYEVILFMAYREYQMLQTTQKGRDLLTKFLSV